MCTHPRNRFQHTGTFGPPSHSTHHAQPPVSYPKMIQDVMAELPGMMVSGCLSDYVRE